MSEQKKYYWIKLKTDFFNQEAVDLLLSQPNGCQYVVLYQMLCLNTANNNGEMTTRVGEMIVPYNIDKIVRDTKYFDHDTVTVALELFKRLGLIYQEENGVLRITDSVTMVGHESASREAIKKREYRMRKRLEDTNGDKKGTNCPTEIEIRVRDKSIDINKEKINKKALEDEFERLWKEYPRKQGKETALKAYMKARSKEDYGKLNEFVVLDGIKRYKQYIAANKTDPKYIKQGSTWFNQHCWEDDYSMETNKRKLSSQEEDFIRELEEDVGRF